MYVHTLLLLLRVMLSYSQSLAKVATLTPTYASVVNRVQLTALSLDRAPTYASYVHSGLCSSAGPADIVPEGYEMTAIVPTQKTYKASLFQ